MQPQPVTTWSRVLARVERRLPALTRLKHPEALPIRLNRHRIYVLPTRFGLMYSAVLLVMLLGALNYNNNPALLLTCLLGAACYQSVFPAFRTLDRLVLHALRADPCHARDALRVHLIFDTGTRPRHDLCLRADLREWNFALAAGSGEATAIEFTTRQRGWFRPGRMRLSSEYPFGLFHVWSWINPEFAALVYPRLELHPPPLPASGIDAERASRRHDGDDLATLREYRPNDPLRNIAWKASARYDALLVKEYEQPSGQRIELDYAALPGLDREARIRRLASWVCMAEAAQVRYALRLPDQRIAHGCGADHRHACLRALALLPGHAS